jgi:hypothetical protein
VLSHFSRLFWGWKRRESISCVGAAWNLWQAEP